MQLYLIVACQMWLTTVSTNNVFDSQKLHRKFVFGFCMSIECGNVSVSFGGVIQFLSKFVHKMKWIELNEYSSTVNSTLIPHKRRKNKWNMKVAIKAKKSKLKYIRSSPFTLAHRVAASYIYINLLQATCAKSLISERQPKSSSDWNIYIHKPEAGRRRRN